MLKHVAKLVHLFLVYTDCAMYYVFNKSDVIPGDIVYKSLFYRMPKLRMSTLPMKTLHNTSVETCARSCVQESSFDCQSFDVNNKLQSCRLHNHSSADDRMSVIVSKNTDHYRSKNCLHISQTLDVDCITELLAHYHTVIWVIWNCNHYINKIF